MDRSKPIGQVRPCDAFRFFAGSETMNLPTMYAGSSGGEQVITVVARDCNKEFPIRDFDKAVELYRAVLEELGYLESGNA